MDWLQALDTRLFYFINHSLSNPLFDWLMPLLSGGNGAMPWFTAAALIAAIVCLFSGKLHLRLCALMIILVVAIGDGLIVNTIKHALARPRPCIALPDVIERLGCTRSGSMPSAHAANWFAATMVAFLFYRRSVWFMLPMAAAVAFSRVYNGVHYPGDVLVGAILGAGYAFAIVVAAQVIWDWLGENWFPLWHKQFPLLLGRRIKLPDNSYVLAAKTEAYWLPTGYWLILAMLAGRWIYLASGTIELSQDEAYQWTWSKHLDLSYYSKPLGIAFIQFAGTHLFGDTAFGVRFFSPLFAAITSVLLLRFLAREIGPRPSFWLLVVATATPLLGVGTILMTIDPPLVLCWTWAMIAGWRAVRPDGATRDWVQVGLAMGLGVLFKYTAALEIVCFGIFFALMPAARAHLKRPGPAIALAIVAACTSPVIIWNASHHWITVSHVAGNAGLHGQWHFTLRYLLEFIGAEFALLNPVFFVGAVWAMFGSWKMRHERPLWLYLSCMGAPVFLGHLLYSLHSRILPNWIAPAILPMFCLMVVYWADRFRQGWGFVKPAFLSGVGLGVFIVAVMYQSNLLGKLVGRPLPGEVDPARRVRGWTQSAAMVEDARKHLEAKGKPAFILCSHYGITGLYSFYLPQARENLKDFHPSVFPLDSDQPGNQFYFWPEYDYRAAHKGENAIYVSEAKLYKLQGWWWRWPAHLEINRLTPTLTVLPARIDQQFESVVDLGEQDVKIGDRIYHRIHLWECYDLK